MAVSDFLPILMPLAARCRQDITWQKKGANTICRRNKPLKRELLLAHLRGDYKVGICPIQEGGTTTQIAVLDLDSHRGETPWEGMLYAVRAVITKLESENMQPVVCRSSGGQGVHIFLIWDNPQDAYSVRKFLAEEILKPLGFKNGAKGVAKGEIEIFPKQDHVPMGDCGSQFILPMAGLSVPLIEEINYEAGDKEDWLRFAWRMSPPIATRDRPAPTPKVERLIHDDKELQIIETALAKVDPDCGYDIWLKIGMGLHAGTQGSDEGLDIFDNWSSKALTQYQGRIAVEAKWQSFRLDKEKSISLDTVKMIAREAGWQEDYSVDFEEVVEETQYDAKGIKLRPLQPLVLSRSRKRSKKEWLIKGIIQQRGAGMVFGPSGDGKSFALLDMALAIAAGRQWNGRRTGQGKVIYICAEGADDFVSRLDAYCQVNNISGKELDEHFAVIFAAPNFMKKDIVLELAKEITGHYDKTDLIIIDTLAQTTTGGDENSAKDMGIMENNVMLLRDLTKATSCFAHHTGKDEDRGARGSTALKGACDFQIRISREEEKRLLWVDKMKGGKDGFGYNFRLKVIQVGTDDDGDIIDSCVVEYDPEQVATKKKNKAALSRKKGYWEDAILKAIDEQGGASVKVDIVIDTVVENAPYDPASGKDRRREYARRAIESLQKDDQLKIEKGRIVIDLSA